MSVRVSTSSGDISACSGLMYSGVPMKVPNCGKLGAVCQGLGDGLGDAEVDNPQHRPFVGLCDQHVGGLQIPVDDPLLVRVLDAFTELDEEFQPRPHRQPVTIAVVDDGLTGHVLHREVRTAFGSGPAIKIFAMAGWSSTASACRSASKRAITCAESMPGLITLRATRRRTGLRCSASQTSPMPPSPSRVTKR